MLVLTRKIGEKFQCSTVDGTEIMVEILKINSGGTGRVAIGITAPSHVKIVRNELLGVEAPAEPPQESALPIGAERTVIDQVRNSPT